MKRFKRLLGITLMALPFAATGFYFIIEKGMPIWVFGTSIIVCLVIVALVSAGVILYEENK